jgi:hypothetical protein
MRPSSTAHRERQTVTRRIPMHRRAVPATSGGKVNAFTRMAIAPTSSAAPAKNSSSRKKAPMKPINAQSPPGHAMPRPSPLQNTPKDQSSRPTINFREFSGRRVRGRCTKHPTARTNAATADAPSAAGQSCESIGARSVGCRYQQRARADAAVLEQWCGPRTNSGDRPCRSKFLRQWRQQV